MTVKITLRGKHISKGRKSLYLDFWPAIVNKKNGKPTRREFLGLYITDDIQTKDVVSFDNNGKKYFKVVPLVDKRGNQKKRILTPIEKKGNKETLRIAEGILQKRSNILNKPEIYVEHEKIEIEKKRVRELSFLDYYSSLAGKRKGNNYIVWRTSHKYLVRFSEGELKFKDVTEGFCNDYRDYLLSTYGLRNNKNKLSQNTAHSYFNMFKAVLRKFDPNINSNVIPIEKQETKKEFLTMEELNKMVNAQCPNPILKRASLFSALTGLRFSDIEKLIWSEVLQEKSKYSIYFRQQKTDSIEALPISQQAYDLLGDRRKGDEKVFEGLQYSSIKPNLLRWLMSAGIDKNLSFHSFRYTYATLQIKHGTDIYTVSKMLGHKDIRTTQVYAKVVPESKRATTDKIKLNYEKE